MDVLKSLWTQVQPLIRNVNPLLVALAVIAIINRKVLPFVWHIRVFYGFGGYLLTRRALPASTVESPTLFGQSIYKTTTPPGEMDYNLHKSNSTYFTDLDMARGYHTFMMFREGIRAYQRKGSLVPAMGGVTCTFKRELGLWKKFEIWTRVLSWDRKWIYLVSYFVEAGVVKPSAFKDQPWKRISGTKEKPKAASQTAGGTKKEPIIYAMCISKYAMKQGRKTIPPVEFLQACGYLPGVGEDVDTKDGAVWARNDGAKSKDSELLEVIETRRLKGLVAAERMAGLDDALSLFDTEGQEVMACYPF